MPFRVTQRFMRKQPFGRLLFVALATAGALTWWAWTTQPPSRLVGFARIGGGASLQITAPVATHPQRAWSIDLRLDSSLPAPGPRWVVHEGKVRNQGYELHWLPSERALLLYRTPRTFLLGSLVLHTAPSTIRMVRQGGRIDVIADGRTVLTCFDPVGVVETPVIGAQVVESSWSCWTNSSLGDATITVQHYGENPAYGADIPTVLGPNPLLTAALANSDRADAPLLAVRQAMAQTESGQRPFFIMDALSTAQIAIDPMSVLTSPSRGITPEAVAADLTRRQRYGQANHELGHLRLWLAMARIELALRSDDRESSGRPADQSQAEVVAAELDELTTIAAAASNPPPELTGVIMALLPALCAQATFHPTYPVAPELVIRTRQPWIDIAGQATALARRTGERRLPTDIALSLRLAGQMLGCLRGAHATAAPPALDWGGAPQPTPVDAPEWLTTRWRAAAGSDPQADRYPDLPMVSGDPVAQAIARLEPACSILPPAAVRGRARILEKLAEVAEEVGGPLLDAKLNELRIAWETIPGREGVLSRVITALALANVLKQDPKRGLILSDDQLRWALEDLNSTVEERPLVLIDPVAFALDDLIRTRHPDLAKHMKYLSKADQTGGQEGKELALRKRLAAFKPLLAGNADATAFIWIGGLRPSEALIAALAEQECARLNDPSGMTPGADWALLRRLPCLTLPAELLIPAAAHQPGEPDGAESGGPLPP